MFEQMPLPPQKSEAEKAAEKKKESFLTEFLKGSRKYIATGLGAMILLLSAEALAKGKPARTAEDEFDELDKEVEAMKVTAEDVNAAVKSFHTALDILQANPAAKEKMKKILDETLAKLGSPEEKLEVVAQFRAQLEARLDAQASKAKPEAAPELAPAAATTAESGAPVESRKDAVVVEGETQMGSFDSYVRDGVLSPDYNSKIPDKAKFGIGKTTLLGRLTVLKMRIDAVKQAEARGEKDRAVSLRNAVEQQKKMLEKTYGDILL